MPWAQQFAHQRCRHSPFQACQKCPEGRFSDSEASTSCNVCPNGLVAQNQGANSGERRIGLGIIANRWWQLFSPRKLGKISNLTIIFFQMGWQKTTKQNNRDSKPRTCFCKWIDSKPLPSKPAANSSSPLKMDGFVYSQLTTLPRKNQRLDGPPQKWW